MAELKTNVELVKLDVIAGVSINVNISVFSVGQIKVYMTDDRVPANFGADYDISMINGMPSFRGGFRLTPTTSMIEKIALTGLPNKIYIQRVTPLITQFTQTDSFYRDRVVDEFDRSLMRQQELSRRQDAVNEEVDISLRSSVRGQDREDVKRMPAAASRVGKSIIFDSNGDPVMLPLTPLPDVPYEYAMWTPSTPGIQRSIQSKLRDEINVLDFGDAGQNGAYDSEVIQKAIDYIRFDLTDNTKPTLAFGSEFGNRRNFRIEQTLDLTGIRAYGFTIDFNGSVLLGATNGQPVIDALDSEHRIFRDGSIFGPASLTPSYGVQIGRGVFDYGAGVGRGAVGISMENMHFTGEYTRACVINSAAEIFMAYHCDFWNSSTDPQATCLMQDAMRKEHITSQFFVVDVPNDTYSSHNDNLFLNCTFENIDVAGVDAAIVLHGRTQGHRFINCYAQNEYGWIVYVTGSHVGLELDMHGEATHLTNFLVAGTSEGDVNFYDLRLFEYFMFTTGAFITTGGGPGKLNFFNSEISIPGTFTNQRVFFPNTTEVNYHGTLKLGEAIDAGTYNLSDLTKLSGDVFVAGPATSVVGPANGSYRVVSALGDTRHYGKQIMASGQAGIVGWVIGSASTITIPATGDFFSVIGANDIYTINFTARDEGREVILIFSDGGLTLHNSFAGNTILAGDYVTEANNLIRLRGASGKWWEIARSSTAVN